MIPFGCQDTGKVLMSVDIHEFRQTNDIRGDLSRRHSSQQIMMELSIIFMRLCILQPDR
jgi:hypothetical protein